MVIKNYGGSIPSEFHDFPNTNTQINSLFKHSPKVEEMKMFNNEGMNSVTQSPSVSVKSLKPKIANTDMSKNIKGLKEISSSISQLSNDKLL